jgi:hypothetical protein
LRGIKQIVITYLTDLVFNVNIILVQVQTLEITKLNYAPNFPNPG